MRRGAKPSKAKVGAKRPVASKLRKDEGVRVRNLEKRLAEALEQLQTGNRELAESREQQTATREILHVISGRIQHTMNEVTVEMGPGDTVGDAVRFFC